jgi:hypothetical protein
MHNFAFKSFCILCLSFLCFGSLSATEKTRTVKPVYYTGNGLPELIQMTRVSIDPVQSKLAPYLDIIANYFCFSDTKFYFAIQTRSPKFPSYGKLGNAWYSYMAVMVNPADAKTVWALTYIKVPLARYKPALYRIDVKKTSSLIRLGSIDYRIDKASNALIMSCDISSLLADPQFAAWYNTKEPLFGLGCIVNKTTIIPYRTTSPNTTEAGINITPKK